MKTSLKARVTFFVLFFCFFVSFSRWSHSATGKSIKKWRKKNEISSLKGKRDTQMKNNLKSEKKKE